MRWLFHGRTMSRRCSASKRPVKSELNLAMTSSQNGVLYRRGFPKAQKFGAKWLSIMMINELDVPANDLWKYVDDKTISETISKNQDSHIQAASTPWSTRASLEKFQLNETKCKELCINFSTKNTTSFNPVVVDGMPIELVATAKILGLNVSSDLKWNSHIDSIIKKAQRHLYSFDCFLSCRFRFF